MGRGAAMGLLEVRVGGNDENIFGVIRRKERELIAQDLTNHCSVREERGNPTPVV